MTGDSRLTDREQLHELADTAVTLGQRLHDLHPGVIREGGECGHLANI